MSIVDYAHPCMMAERALKEAHLAMLAKEYDKATQHTVEALIAASHMYDAIKHMKEQDCALRQQA